MPELTLLKTARELAKKHDFSGPRLREAIPYINTFTGKRFVLKIGGSVLNDLTLLPYLIEDIAFMKKVGVHIILVHGGSRQLNSAMIKRSLKIESLDGLRVTSPEILQLAAEVFGDISKIIKTEIGKNGYKAVIFDRNSGLVKSKQKNSKLGLVGIPQTVDTSLLESLSDDVIPVVSSVTAGIACGDIGFNVNADAVAGIIAAKMKTEKLILMTDVDGVLDKDGNLLSSLTMSQVEDLIERGIINGGMIPKVNTCLEALKAGAHKCHIIRGGNHSFIDEILTNRGVGTEFVKDEEIQANSCLAK